MERRKDNCTFCYPDDDLDTRIINQNDDLTSFVSSPRFRPNHVIVTPSVHVEKMAELAAEQNRHILASVMAEVAIMADIIDEGRGTVILQKFAPLVTENGIKMNHMHIHAWPITEQDVANGIVVPAPQTYDEFMLSSEREASSIRWSGLLLRVARHGIPKQHR